MPESTPQHPPLYALGSADSASHLTIVAAPSGIPHGFLDSHEQWHAWRIGRDCRAEGYDREAALARLRSVYSQPQQEFYFDAGFSGNACPALTAPNPDSAGVQAAPAQVPAPSYNDALEQAAQLAIKFTSPPRDLLGPATTAMKQTAALGVRLADAIRNLSPKI